MADFSKFRTAVSGFNRTDVVNYIESASMEHQKALRKLTDERDKLAAENAQLQTQLTGLQARLIQVQADNDALTEQVNTLAQEGSDLAEQLKAAEAARAEAAAQPQPAPEAGPIEEEPAAETPGGPRAGALAPRKGADRLSPRRADRAQRRRPRPADLYPAVESLRGCSQPLSRLRRGDRRPGRRSFHRPCPPAGRLC